jgi:AcrR family transcriptional regulator
MITTLLPVLTRPDAAESATGSAASEPYGATFQRRAGRERAERSKAAIVDAARGIFASHGYHDATIAAVAHASGVGETTIYEHFGSKAGLAAACFEPALDLLRRQLAHDAHRPPIERLRGIVRRLIVLFQASPAVCVAVLDVASHPVDADPDPDPNDPRIVLSLGSLLEPLLAAVGGGEGTSEEPVADLAGLLGMSIVMWSYANPERDPEEGCRLMRRFEPEPQILG